MGVEGAEKKFPFIVMKFWVISASLAVILIFFIILCFKPQFRFNTVPNEIIYLRLTAYFYLIYLTDSTSSVNTTLSLYRFVSVLVAV